MGKVLSKTMFPFLSKINRSLGWAPLKCKVARKIYPLAGVVFVSTLMTGAWAFAGAMNK